MKYLAILFMSVALFACQSPSKGGKSGNTNDIGTQVGGDKDSHGCLIGAGYTWSQLKEECIRPWEGTITLNPVDKSGTATLVAYALIDSTKQKAEIFLKEEKESILLDGQSATLYTKDKYKLSQSESSWSLAVQDKVLYQEKK